MLTVLGAIALILLFLASKVVFFADEISCCLQAKTEELRARTEAIKARNKRLEDWHTKRKEDKS